MLFGAVTSRGKMEACPRSPGKGEPLDGVAGLLQGPPQGQVSVPAGQLAFQRSDSSSSWRTESWRPDKDELFAAKDAPWRHLAAAGKKPPAVATRVPGAGAGAAAGTAAKPPRFGSSGAVGATSRRASSDRRSGEHPPGGSSSAGSAAGTSVAGSTAGSAASSPYGSPFAHASQQSAQTAFSPAPRPSAASGASDATPAGGSGADASVNGHSRKAAVPPAASLARTAVPAQQDQRQSMDQGRESSDHQHNRHQQEGCSCAPAAGSLHVQLQAAAQEEPAADAATAQDVAAAAADPTAGGSEAVGGRPAAAPDLEATQADNSTNTAANLSRVRVMSKLSDNRSLPNTASQLQRRTRKLAWLLLVGLLNDRTALAVLQVASPFEQQTAASRGSEQASSTGNGYMVPYQQHAGFVSRNAPMLRAIPRFCEYSVHVANPFACMACTLVTARHARRLAYCGTVPRKMSRCIKCG